MLAVLAVGLCVGWTTVDTILGANTSSRFGGRVAVSSDALCFASYNIDKYGSLGEELDFNVYHWNGSRYVPLYTLGRVLSRSVGTYTLNAAVALSGDCTHLSVSDGAEYVKVFRVDTEGKRWAEINTVTGTAADEYGRALALPAVGADILETGSELQPLLVGAPQTDGGMGDDSPTDRGALYAYPVVAGTNGLTPVSTTTIQTAHDFGTDVQYAWSVTDRIQFVVSAFNSDLVNYATALVYTSTDGGTTMNLLGTLQSSCSSETDGFPVAISGDGLYVAIGCPYGNATATSGTVELFYYNGVTYASNRTFAGSAADAAEFGASVSLSEDGSVLSIGTNGAGTASTVTYAEVWERSGATWTARTPITGPKLNEVETNVYDLQTRLSADGNRLILGIPNYGAGGDPFGRGRIVVYDYVTSSPTAQPGAPAPSSSSKKHTDGELYGSIAGAVVGSLLLGAVATTVYRRTHPSPPDYKSILQ